MKVYIMPNYGAHPDKADGGIRRVVEAQKKHLPKFGIEVVDDPREADVINNHGSSLVSIPGIPSVNSCHGFMWSKYEWGSWAHEINRQVVLSMTHAVAHTAPSEWVKRAMVRGMLIDPTVIYHGVDPDEWDPDQEKQDFVLWNKARKDLVSDPEDMNSVARLLPDIKFLSTIGRPTNNVRITGPMPYPDMKNYIQTSGVYLATARETFGIGTLEAMICGIPVVGWDWGGQSEIIIHNETGYLAEPGDYQDLARGIRHCMENRAEMGEKARADALDRWGWEKRIEQYANVFKEVHRVYTQERPKVSVILTTYNLGHYLPDALNSVKEQSEESWECIIVDDCSTDNSSEIAQSYADKDNRFKYLRPKNNKGLSLARNYGMEQAKGQYIIMLDADDMLDIHALEVLSGELDKDWGIHVAYGHLDTFTDDDPERKRNSWPLKEFNWKQQMAHLNQLPYCAMMRREVLERSGGYRKRHWRAEDAALWCRISSFGFRIKKVTQAAVIVYRMRGDSKSGGESGDGDWTAWYPWRIAGDPRSGMKKIKAGHEIPKHLVPWGSPRENIPFWDIPDREDPFVSVIIPVGPGHEEIVIDALESLVAQTYSDWEVIVVNDTVGNLDLKHAPYATIVETLGELGPGVARNYGATFARGQTLLWLDADDYLLPNALQEMVKEYKSRGPSVIYSDWLKNEGDIAKIMSWYETKEFVCGDVLNRLKHSVTCLVPTRAHKAIGGFDEDIPGWEDWDYYIALQDYGLCSYRIPLPLFVYRFYGGDRREESYGMKEKLLQYIRNKWSKYYDKEESMPCRGCGGGKKRKPIQQSAAKKTAPTSGKVVDGYKMILLEYTGLSMGPYRINGQKPTNARYRFGLSESHKFGYVYPHDVEYLIGKRNPDSTPVFRIVPTPEVEKEEVKPKDFVGQEVEKAPDPKPEPEQLESFNLDIDVNKTTIAKLKELLADPNYVRIDILDAWIRQEEGGKSRKTVLKLLRAEYDKLV